MGVVLMGLLTKVRDALEPKSAQLDLWEPTIHDHMPDGFCDLYAVVLSDRDVLAWARTEPSMAFRDGKSTLDFCEVELQVRKKGTATGWCIVGVVKGQAGIWAGPHPFNDGKNRKVGRWDTLILEPKIMLGSEPRLNW